MANATARAGDSILTLANPVFCAYLISSCVLVLKIMLVAVLTMYQRSVHKAFMSPEDVDFNKGQLIMNDAVERIRRGHLNDLENIPIFWASAFAYIFTEPALPLALVLFFGFTIVRIVHTVVYCIIVAPQPTRTILFLTGFLITGYMAVHSIVIACKFLC